MTVHLKKISLAVLAMVLAIAARFALDPWLGDRLPLITLYLGAAAAAWFSSFLIAAIANLAGLAACIYLFIPPRGSLSVSDDWVVTGAFAQLLVAGGIVWLVRVARHREMQVEEARRVLQGTVDELSRAKETLERADREKNEAIARIAHELRNPLQPIVHSATTLQLKEPTRAELSALAGMIRRQAAIAEQLVEDLIDLTRIERGTLRLAFEDVPLSSLLSEAVETIRWKAEEKPVCIHRHDAPGLIVRADRVRLFQAITNLLTNAVRYTPKGGEVWIETSECAEGATVTIRDSGIGIEREWLERLGQPFLRSPAAIKKSPNGLGIGLALAKSIVELHGGTLIVRSDGPGAGTLVTLTLPRAGTCVDEQRTRPEGQSQDDVSLTRLCRRSDNNAGDGRSSRLQKAA